MDKKIKCYVSEINDLEFTFQNCQELLVIACSIFSHIEKQYADDIKLISKMKRIKNSEYKDLAYQVKKNGTANIVLANSAFSSLRNALITDINTHSF